MRHLNTFLTTFLLRKSTGKNEMYAIYLRINLNGEKLEISTKEQVTIDNWDFAKGCVKGKSIEIQQLNIILERIKERALMAFRDFQMSEKPFTIYQIKDKILGLKSDSKSLLDLFFYHDETEKHKLAIGTQKHYVTTKNLVVEFLKTNYKRNDIPIDELNFKFITDFENFIYRRNASGAKPIANNALMKHIERIRKVVKIAVNNEWLDKDPFVKFKVTFEKTNRGFLTQEELQLIEQKEFKIERLGRIKDLFIFSCYTGLAYIDAQQLTQNNLSIGIDCEIWLKTEREKTSTSVTLPILPQAMKIIKKYQNDPRVSNSGKLLPAISNMKFNAYLKEVADICGITKNLTSHMARHTFATTVTLTNGVPIETVSKMLGHSSIKTTQIYAKVVDTKISSDMRALKNILVSNNNEMVKLRANG